MAECMRAGGLSRAVAESLLTTRSLPPAEAPKSVLCPRPRHLSALNRALSSESLSEEESVVPTNRPHNASDLDASVAELRRILEVDCTLESDTGCPFLGVSPPLRSGAHNPLAHDTQWKLKAQQASRSSLEALQRAGALDRCAQHVFYGGGGQCRGDLRLLLSPPDYSSGVLSATCDAAGVASGGFDSPTQPLGVSRGRGKLAPPSWRGAALSAGGDARIFS
ncbi:hypothetical protein N2152v2_005826 [Parachlorella kessleri]